MVKRRKSQRETLLALKYPDYHTWRDVKTIRNGYWPDGSIVRISDPEMKPGMDDLHEKLVNDKKFAKEFFKDIIDLPDE